MTIFPRVFSAMQAERYIVRLAVRQEFILPERNVPVLAQEYRLIFVFLRVTLQLRHPEQPARAYRAWVFRNENNDDLRISCHKTKISVPNPLILVVYLLCRDVLQAHNGWMGFLTGPIT